MNRPSPTPILTVHNLTVDIPGHGRVLDGIDLKISRGESLGLVGESGSGKSMLAKTLVRLERPARIVSGSIVVNGEELTGKNSKEMAKIRGRSISLAIQDPQAAMDPVFRMGAQFGEVLRSSNGTGRKEKHHVFPRIREWLTKVGISSPEERCRQYPHQWSRGMLQRAQLVMAFSTGAPVVILDEVTSALDPTVTLQILDLIRRMKEEHQTGILLITHDIFVAARICDRMAVMKNGQVVEIGDIVQMMDEPIHPYTRTLVSGAWGNDID